MVPNKRASSILCRGMVRLLVFHLLVYLFDSFFDMRKKRSVEKTFVDSHEFKSIFVFSIEDFHLHYIFKMSIDHFYGIPKSHICNIHNKLIKIPSIIIDIPDISK